MYQVMFLSFSYLVWHGFHHLSNNFTSLAFPLMAVLLGIGQVLIT